MGDIEVKMIQAECGDCFLITINSIKPINILVDCGTKNTYTNSLKPILLEMKEQDRELDYLILTHMHEDHIGGALALFKENVSNKESKIIRINNIIFNGIKGLQIEHLEESKCDENDKIIYKGVISKGKAAMQNRELSHDISAKQEMLISSYILKGEYKWNNGNPFNSGPIYVFDDNLPILQVDNDTCLTFISPNIDNLKKLNKSWISYLKSIKRRIKIVNNKLTQEAYEAYMFLKNCSESEPILKDISQYGLLKNDEIQQLSDIVIKQDNQKTENGSSIAFILTYKNKNLLFLGDAFSEVYYQNLLKWKNRGGSSYFNAIKVSHHGSKANTSDEFLKEFDSSIYLISTDGKYDHPNLETIAKIINRKQVNEENFKRYIIISNKTDSIKCFDDETLKKKFNFDIKYNSSLINISIE